MRGKAFPFQPSCSRRGKEKGRAGKNRKHPAEKNVNQAPLHAQNESLSERRNPAIEPKKKYRKMTKDRCLALKSGRMPWEERGWAFRKKRVQRRSKIHSTDRKKG